MKKCGFDMHKQSFRDALYLRFGWTPTRIASHCPCRHPFSVSHAFSCSKGAIHTLRHNAVRDITAQLLMEVCPNIGVEPQLQLLSGETFQYRTVNTDEHSRLDNSNRTTVFDVRIFNAFAPSNCLSTTTCYRKHKLEKRRNYEQRVIEVEHGLSHHLS